MQKLIHSAAADSLHQLCHHHHHRPSGRILSCLVLLLLLFFFLSFIIMKTHCSFYILFCIVVSVHVCLLTNISTTISQGERRDREEKTVVAVIKGKTLEKKVSNHLRRRKFIKVKRKQNCKTQNWMMA